MPALYNLFDREKVVISSWYFSFQDFKLWSILTEWARWLNWAGNSAVINVEDRSGDIVCVSVFDRC